MSSKKLVEKMKEQIETIEGLFYEFEWLLPDYLSDEGLDWIKKAKEYAQQEVASFDK